MFDWYVDLIFLFVLYTFPNDRIFIVLMDYHCSPISFVVSMILSEGSVLVDYFVELNELGRSVNTADLKRLFHNSLLKSPSNSNLKDTSQNEPLQMGNFMVDPKHIDFVGKHLLIL